MTNKFLLPAVSRASIALLVALPWFLTACRDSSKHYSLQGRVLGKSDSTRQVTVNHGDIPGFMAAMTMGYSVKNANLLSPLSPEDKITADVVVNGSDVYLENIVVVKKADQAKSPAAGDVPPASPQPAK